MRYRYIYKYKTGLTKVKTRLAIAFSILGLGASGIVGSMAIFGSAHALTPPTWDAKAPTSIDFTCGGGLYPHTLATVTEDNTNGNLTGTGSYDVDTSYTWNMTGNTTGNTVTMQILYTGTSAGTIYNLTGTIASDGSVSGTADSNCQTFTMPSGSFAQHCTPTGFYRDGINMTARQIGGDVTGTLDASGCNIGVYYGPGTTGSVDNADISGSNYFGIVVQKAVVDVTNSHVHNIGETPFNGTQHGVGIYYANVTGLTNGDCSTTGTTSGTISMNVVDNYQKGGIVATCTNTDVSVMDNTVTGNGLVNYIAQNGIQVSLGATGTVGHNSVIGNEYTGANGASSGGILVFGGCGGDVSQHVNVFGNTLTNNDVGLYLVNYNANCSGPTNTWTRDNAHNNVISKTDGITNVSGWGSGVGYQAGIEDIGRGDNVHNNNISGDGYTPESPMPANSMSPGQTYISPLDSTQTQTLNAKIHNNTF